MTTIAKQILPIPEDSVQGTGSYTVPANKYALLSASATSSAAGRSHADNNNPSGGSSGSSSSSVSQCWLVEGDSVSTSSSSGASSTSGNGGDVLRNGHATVNVNGTRVIRSNSSGGSGTNGSQSDAFVSVQSHSQWNASIFPIPKENLPDDLIQGN